MRLSREIAEWTVVGCYQISWAHVINCRSGPVLLESKYSTATQLFWDHFYPRKHLQLTVQHTTTVEASKLSQQLSSQNYLKFSDLRTIAIYRR
jgi:hypothetical protein